MTSKILNLLVLSQETLLSEALLAQFQQGTGVFARSLSFPDLAASGPDSFENLDLVVVIGTKTTDIEHALRSKFYRGPIAYLAARDGELADPDVIGLPLHYPQLQQKLRSLAASYWFRDDLVIPIGTLMLRPAFKDIARPDGSVLALTDKEVEVLVYLYKAGGKIISRDVLLAEIWGYNAGVSTHTLETHIYRLRQKIETEPEFAGLLLTEAGGYRLQTAGGE